WLIRSAVLAAEDLPAVDPDAFHVKFLRERDDIGGKSGSQPPQPMRLARSLRRLCRGHAQGFYKLKTNGPVHETQRRSHVEIGASQRAVRQTQRSVPAVDVASV